MKKWMKLVLDWRYPTKLLYELWCATNNMFVRNDMWLQAEGTTYSTLFK